MILCLKLCKFMSFKKPKFLWRHFLSLSLKLCQFLSFKQKPNIINKFVEPHLWSYVSLWVSNESQFLWRHFLRLSLKLSKFTSFKQKEILMKTFVESHFEIMSVYEFQTKANSREDNCWASFWSYVSLWVSNKS